MSEETKTQATQETKTQEIQEVPETEKAQEQSFYDQALETVEKVPGVMGEYLGKAALLLLKPLNQIHKHTTEPFIEKFKKAFNDDQ